MLYRYWFPIQGKAHAFTAWAPNSAVAKMRAFRIWQSYATAMGGGLIYHIERLK